MDSYIQLNTVGNLFQFKTLKWKKHIKKSQAYKNIIYMPVFQSWYLFEQFEF